MTKAVIDTNVLVSGLLNRRGSEAAVLFAAADNKLTWCVSLAILAEYETVLKRPKFSHLPPALISAFLQLAAGGELVEPAFKLAVSPHPDDNRFLECAEKAGAQFLVTGNLRHFPPRWKGTEILNARDLLQRLGS